jgi:hypothetical protein
VTHGEKKRQIWATTQLLKRQGGVRRSYRSIGGAWRRVTWRFSARGAWRQYPEDDWRQKNLGEATPAEK